jgi:hypothetical protein
MYAKETDTSAAITNAEKQAADFGTASPVLKTEEENKQSFAEHSPPPFTSSTSTLYNKPTLLHRDGKDSQKPWDLGFSFRRRRHL